MSKSIFFNPKDGETDFHSFAAAFHKTLDSDTFLGPFTYHKYERHLRIGMSEEGHAIITITRPIDVKDLVAFRSAEFRLLFGNGWEQIWKGKLVHPKPGYEGVISYSYTTDTVEIGYETDSGEQVPMEVTKDKLVGLVLKSRLILSIPLLYRTLAFGDIFISLIRKPYEIFRTNKDSYGLW